MTKTEVQASRIRQRLSQIPTEMAGQVRRLVKLRAMFRGYVYHSQRRCGKASCRCARGELHAAWVVATKVGGKQTTRSLTDGLRRKVQSLTDNYRQCREARSTIRRLCGEAMDLSGELESLLCQDLFRKRGKR